jgi:deazaflavin-dependent oxidoreductase (nitroreductase family)
MSSSDDQRRSAADAYAADPVAVNRRIVEEYRANGGNVAGMGGPSGMLLLTTTGARTGQPRTAPMMYRLDGDRLVVFASNIGAEHHPGWYRNLVAHPGVTVEVGAERFDAIAVVAAGEERERLWRLFPFPQHQEKTSRQIPVVTLERRPPAGA